MMMIQFLIKTIINMMGKVYVFLDRKELCNHIEDKFRWERDSFWNLESTQKIRLCCQVARNTMSGEEE